MLAWSLYRGVVGRGVRGERGVGERGSTLGFRENS